MTEPAPPFGDLGRICRGCGNPTERLASHCQACILAMPETEIHLATCAACDEPFISTSPPAPLGVICPPCCNHMKERGEL